MHTPHPHESAHLHVSGEATYVDDIPELAGTLHAALGLSQHAHAMIRSIDFSAVRAAPGVVAVLTAKDIPGENNCGPIVHDDPIFAEGVVQYVGQPIFAVIAESYDAARRAARQAKIELRGAAGCAHCRRKPSVGSLSSRRPCTSRAVILRRRSPARRSD